MSSKLLRALLDAVDAEVSAAVELRHALHAHPEEGHDEEKTSELVVDALGPDGLQRVAGTGVWSVVGSGGRQPVVLRAELDGLRIPEETGASFAADNGRMHACGHDVHMAALVAVRRAAAALELPRPLVALFQPSEEAYPSGAEQLVKEEALNRLDPCAVLGVHVHPDVPWRSVSVAPGPINAASDMLEITVQGSGGHAAYPHRARDPVLAISHVIVALQQVVSRRADPVHGVVLTIGEVHAGSAENVIPARATARGILRTLSPNERTPLREAVGDIVETVARSSGCLGSVVWTEGEPPLVNDGRLAARVRHILVEAGFGLATEMRSCGADDFGFYAEVAPILMMFLGLQGHREMADHPLHHPRFLPPDDAVGATARAMAAAYVGAVLANGEDKHEPVRT
jgi:amidohydrolase